MPQENNNATAGDGKDTVSPVCDENTGTNYTATPDLLSLADTDENENASTDDATGDEADYTDDTDDTDEAVDASDEDDADAASDGEADGEDSAAPQKKPSLSKEIFEWAEMIVVSFCVVVMIFTFIARPAGVVGDSMLYTLIDDEALIVSPVTDKYRYKDIVVFQIPENIGKAHGDAIVKRVIATEGQWVDVNLYTWEVFVADSEEALATAKPLDEPYVNYVNTKGLAASIEFPLQVPEGHLFVMGDNRSESYDSRAFGCIKEEYVMGKVIVRLWPLSKFGKVD